MKVRSLSRSELNLREFRNDVDAAPRTLRSETVPIEALKQAPRQVRQRSKVQMAKLVASVEAFGVVAPILLGRDNTIIRGHALLEAAKRCGHTEVAVVRLEHLSDDQARMLRLTLHRLEEEAVWDDEGLRHELQHLFQHIDELTISASVMGFEPGEIDRILEQGVVESQPELVADPAHDAVCRKGDLMLCGSHRVLVGDAKDPSSYAALMMERTAQCVITDPPYNVAIKGHVSRRKSAREFLEASGKMSDADYEQLLTSFLEAAADRCPAGAVLMVFVDWRHQTQLMSAAQKAGLVQLNLCVWVKDAPGMGSLYRSAHELVCIFSKGKASPINNVQLGRYGRNRSNVWSYPGANTTAHSVRRAAGGHPTPKPVSLIHDAIRDVSHRNAAVLDPFLGSGSTLIACERSGRHCYGIELDPLYADVAIRRWQNLTGREATHATSGLTFAALERQRLAASSVPPEAAAARLSRGKL